MQDVTQLSQSLNTERTKNSNSIEAVSSEVRTSALHGHQYCLIAKSIEKDTYTAVNSPPSVVMPCSKQPWQN